jgi:hypothetical protein
MEAAGAGQTITTRIPGRMDRLPYVIATGIGGATGPLLFGSLPGTGDKSSLFLGYGASALMLVAAVVAALWGVDAEQESLEDVAAPLSGTSAEPA